MSKRAKICMMTALIVSQLPMAAGAATADKTFHSSKDHVRTACNKDGGNLLGVSDLGSYGCEFKDGTMVLCNKKDTCTHYTARMVPARIRHDFEVKRSR